MTPLILVAAIALAGAVGPALGARLELLLSGARRSVGQERAPAKVPKKGDTIVVKGCLRGSALESTETGFPDSEARLMSALVYRLKGDKDTLKQMRQEYDGNVVEATGILKSTLPPADESRGATIGRTRIRIGVGAPHVGSAASAEANRSIPVLEVKSYEGSAVKCGG